MDWRNHWQQVDSAQTDEEFLRQVGKTVGGNPISPAQLQLIPVQIAEALRLDQQDQVLDLCCGNGLITAKIAPACRAITGIDFSESLIATALQHHREADNVLYLQGSVLDIGTPRIPLKGLYDKAYMYEALQHFTEAQFGDLLFRLAGIMRSQARLFFGSVPDLDMIWSFYNTPDRREEFHRRSRDGTEAIGTWWSRDRLAQIAGESGLRANFHAQHPSLHTAHYRFDVILTPSRD